jgi:hypothetical protein
VIQLIKIAKSSSCAAEYIYLRYWASNCAAMQDLNRKQDDLLQWQIAASQARGTKPQVIFSKSWRRRLAVLERKLKVKCASLCWVYFPRLGSTQRCSGGCRRLLDDHCCSCWADTSCDLTRPEHCHLRRDEPQKSRKWQREGVSHTIVGGKLLCGGSSREISHLRGVT